MVAEDREVADPVGAGAQQRDRRRRRGRLEPDPEEDDVPLGRAAGELERVERRVDHPHVGPTRLRLEQRAAGAGDAHHVPEGREQHLGALGERDRVVDAAHRDHADRAAGAVDEVDLGGDEVLDSVLVDRVGVASADLHDLQHASRLDQGGDLAGELLRQRPRAELGHVFHRGDFLERDPGMAEEAVADADRRNQFDRHLRPPRGELHRRLGLADRDHGRELGRIAAGETVVALEAHPAALSLSSRSSCS